jgi:hypothetical protein
MVLQSNNTLSYIKCEFVGKPLNLFFCYVNKYYNYLLCNWADACFFDFRFWHSSNSNCISNFPLV